MLSRWSPDGQQPVSYTSQFNPQLRIRPFSPPPLPALPALPPLPPPPPLPTLTEIANGVSGAVSFGALLFAILGNDKQQEAAMKVLDYSIPFFTATSPLNRIPSLPAIAPPSPTPLRAIPVEPRIVEAIPASNAVAALDRRVQHLKQNQDEIARQLAAAQAELTLVRVALFWDDDN